MERMGLEALLLRRSTNFAWYTGGADNRVDHASPYGVADVLLTREAEYIFTNNIEAPRMREEQTPHFEVIEHPWYGDEAAAIREVVGDAPLGTDFSLEGSLDVSSEVAPLRYALDADALEHYRKVGADAAAAVAEVADSLEPGMSEYEAAGASRRPAGAGGSLAPCSWRPQTTASPAIATPYRTARTSIGGPCSW
jgi:Xaa-Pro aminopeptidase